MDTQFAQRFGFYCEEVLSGKHSEYVLATKDNFQTFFKDQNVIAVQLYFERPRISIPGTRFEHYFYRSELEEINTPKILAGRDVLFGIVWYNFAKIVDEEAEYRDYMSLRNDD